MRSLYFLLGGLLIAFPFSEKIPLPGPPVTSSATSFLHGAAEAFWVQMKSL